MTKLYFAAPLFSEGEQMYNRYLVDIIQEALPDLDIFLPQEAGEINDKEAYADSIMIAQLDTKEVLASDIMVAVLDGIHIDAGVASEIGVAYQAGIPIVGVYTDNRQQGARNPKKLEALQEVAESQFPYVNLYTVGLIKQRGEVVNSSQNVVAAIQRQLKRC